MPLIRRIPKRGFNNARFTTRYLPVNLEDLNRFDEGARVDEQALRQAGLAVRAHDLAVEIEMRHRVLTQRAPKTEKGIDFCRQHIAKKVANKTFPAPFKLSET